MAERGGTFRPRFIPPPPSHAPALGSLSRALRNLTLTADAGSYALSGQTAALKVGHVLTSAAGSYSLTGQNSTLTYGKSIIAAAGAYTLTGQNASFSVTYDLAGGVGSYTLSGQAASLKKDYILRAAAGDTSNYLFWDTAALQWGGNDLAWGVSTSYVVTGQAATLKVGHVLASGAGSYTLSGQDAGLYVGHRLAIDADSYVLTGYDAGLSYIAAETQPAGHGAGGHSDWYYRKLAERRRRLREEEYKRKLAIRYAERLAKSLDAARAEDAERLAESAKRLEQLLNDSALSQAYLLETVNRLVAYAQAAAMMRSQEEETRRVEAAMRQAAIEAYRIEQDLRDEEEAILLLMML